MLQRPFRLLIFSVVLTLACSSTSVVETRHAAGLKPLGGQRTLVIADVDEKYRAATEDAAVKNIPGAVAAHGLAGASTAASLDTVARSKWDAIVVFSYAGSKLKYTPKLKDADESMIITLDLDVSVRAPSDFKEVWGEKVQYTESLRFPVPWDFDESIKRAFASSIAPNAAVKVARRLAAGVAG